MEQCYAKYKLLFPYEMQEHGKQHFAGYSWSAADCEMAASSPPRRRSSATSDGLEGVILVNEAALVSSDPALVRGVLFEMSRLLGFRQYQRHHNRKTTTLPDFALHANGAAL